MSDNIVEAAKIEDSAGYDENYVFFDTETTSTEERDRIISYALVPMVGKGVQRYFKPDVPIADEAYQVHKVSEEDLERYGAKKFNEKDAAEFIDMIKGKTLIIHNAMFDINMINKELTLYGYGDIRDHCKIIDSLLISRGIPGRRRNSMDALIKEYNLDVGQIMFDNLSDDRAFEFEGMNEHQVKAALMKEAMIKGADKKVDIDELNSLDDDEIHQVFYSGKKKRVHEALLDCQLLRQVWLRLAVEYKSQFKDSSFIMKKEDNNSEANYSLEINKLTYKPRLKAFSPSDSDIKRNIEFNESKGIEF